MRFLLLSTFYPPWSFGGDAQMVRSLARGLVDCGHEVTVAHSVQSHRLLEGKQSPPSGGGWRDEEGVRVVAIDHGLGALAPVASYLSGHPGLMRGRLESLLAQDFDVVHFHNPSLLGAPAIFRSGRSLKLLTLHEYWLVCPMNVLMRNQKELCRRPTCLRCTLHHHRPPQLWRYTSLLRRSLGGLDALLAPSNHAAQRHATLGRHVRIERLANFVHPDPGAGRRRDPALPARFLFAGRLEPIKGAERLVPVFARRPQDELVIAGTGTQEPQLRRHAKALGNVRLTGQLDASELDALYRDASAVIIPTVGEEVCPLVLLEAQARGLPVVASDHGALRELVEAGGGGLLFGNAPELDAALDSVATDACLGASLGRRGRAHYESEWTREVHLRRYFELIGELALARGDHRLAHAARATVIPST